MFDRLIEQLQQQRLNPLPLAINSLNDPIALDLINDLCQKRQPAVLLNSLAFAANRVAAPE
ncbi:MAG: hypothetical protein DSZ16_05610, partial [Candidatus Thioglobus sp.]